MNTPMHATPEQIAALYDPADTGSHIVLRGAYATETAAPIDECGDVGLPYTIDESPERFATDSEAMRAAASKVAELRRSIVVYRDGQPVDVRRF